MRPTRCQTFMEIAHVVAKRATCFRLNVGAVIVSGRSIVAIGYNGVPAGQPHCSGNDCPGKNACMLTTHAEENAMRHLPEGCKGPLDLYVTDSPCEDCWGMIRRDGRISRLFFSTPYRLSNHLHRVNTPEVYRVLPAGYVMDWRTRELVEVPT